MVFFDWQMQEPLGVNTHGEIILTIINNDDHMAEQIWEQENANDIEDENDHYTTQLVAAG